jgi:WD40 repeat protein
MLVILSPLSIKSTNVIDEVSFALEEQKAVIPILYRDCVIPFRLRRLHYLDFRSDYPRGLKELLRTLVPDQNVAQEGQVFDKADQAQKRGEQVGARSETTPEETFGATQTAIVPKLASGKELLSLSGHGGSVESVAWSPDGKRLATGSDDGTVKVWAAETAQELMTLPAQGGIRSMAWNWSSDPAWLAAASNDGKVEIWNADTGEVFDYIETETGTCVAWRPREYWEERICLAVGGGEFGILLRDMRTGNDVRIDSSVISMAWSPNGDLLATGGSDTGKLTKVWAAEPPKEWLSLRGHNGGIYSVSWSPDGGWLATGSNDGTVKLWDVGKVWEARSHRQVLTLSLTAQRGLNEVWAVAWSPNGKNLATGSQDEMPRVWDAKTGSELLRPSGHTGPIKSVAWSPDGKRLATSSEDKTTKVWDVRQFQLL